MTCCERISRRSTACSGSAASRRSKPEASSSEVCRPWVHLRPTAAPRSSDVRNPYGSCRLSCPSSDCQCVTDLVRTGRRLARTLDEEDGMKRPMLLVLAGAGLAAAIAAACSDSVVTPKTSRALIGSGTLGMQHERSADDGRANPATMSERDLAELRQATVQYKSFDFATQSGGYSHQITDCMTDPQLGGMGFHFGKDALIDGKPEKLLPEVLLYEPQKNGEMKFVAVEYIIPFPLWTDAAPPKLFGQQFKRNE